MTTESQRYKCFTRNGGNAIPKHAGPEAKGSYPTAGLTLLWAHNPFRGNFNHWQVSRKEAGQIFFKRDHLLQLFKMLWDKNQYIRTTKITDVIKKLRHILGFSGAYFTELRQKPDR